MKKVLGCFSKKSSNGNNATLPISANTPPYYKQSASRLLLAVLFMLAAVQGVWGGTALGTFTEISSVGDLTSGYYIIVPSKDVDRNKNYAMGGRLNSGSSKYVLSKSISYTTETTIVNPEDSIVYQIGVSASGISLKNYATSKYLFQNNTSSSRLAFNNDECYFLHSGDSIKYSDTKPQGFCLETTYDSKSSTSRHFKYISADASKYFTNYSGSWTSTANTPVRLFKLTSTYTITFDAGSGNCDTPEITALTLGGLTLPSANPNDACAIEGWSFVGWSPEECDELTNTMPIIYRAGEKYYPSSDCTLYAVYRKADESCNTGIVDKTADLAIGDNVLLIYTNGSSIYKEYNGITKPSTVTIGDTYDYTTTPEEKHILEVKAGSSEGSLAFFDTKDKLYLAYSGTSNSLETKTTIVAASSWNVTITSGSASLQNVGTTTRNLYYYSSNPRFACYTSAYSAVQLYKLCYTYYSNPVCCTPYDITLTGSGTVTGEGTFSTDVSSACENATVTLTATPTGGYDFTSWTITKTADGTNITSNVTLSGQTSSATFTMPDYGVTVNATFTPSGYAITLDKNGGDSDGSAVVAENATAFTSGFTPPSRTGYDLLGYYLEAEGTNIVADVNGDFTASVEGWTNGSSQFTRNATGTLYAKWSAKTSTVTLDNQSATTAGEDEVTATYDAAMRSIAEDLPTKTGHTFQGYFDDLNGLGTKYYNADGSSAKNWDKEDATVTLYAYWTPNITVITFDHQATTSAGTTEANATYGETPPAITLPEREGYVFYEYRTAAGKKEGYQIVKNNGNWVNVTDYVVGGKWVYTAGSTVTLYAQWNPVYSVDWRVDNIEYQVDNIVSGDKISSFPDSPSSLHESSDKEFAGWRTSPIDGVTDTDDALFIINDLPAVTSDRTYYAVFGNQKEGSVEKETVIWSENFSSYSNNAVPSGDDNTTNGKGRVVYNDGNVTYTCTNGYNTNTYIYSPDEDTQVLTIGADERDNGTSFGKWEISNLTTSNATALMLTYYHKYNVKVTVTYLDDEDVEQSIIVGGGINTSAAGTYSYIIDSRAYTTFSITFEATTKSGSQIDDVELKVYRPEMEKFVTNSYHSDLSSDEESPEAMNWSEAAWPKGVVPTINDTVVLSNVAMTVDDDDAKAKKIILKNNATLTISPNMALRVDGKITKEDGTATTAEDLRISSGSSGNGTLIFENNGNAATVEMYSKANSTADPNPTWQYIGTPFTGSIALYNYYGGYLSKWGTGGWNDVSGSDEMDPFVGYCVSYPSTGHIFEMTGELVSTSAEKEITVGAGKNKVVANSWTAPIQIAQLDDAFDGVPATVYLFNTGYDADGTGDKDAVDRYAPGTYVTIPIASAAAVGVTKISSLQGFYLKNTNGTDGTFTLNYANHVVPDGEENIQNGAMHAPKRVKAEDKPIVAKILASGSRYDALLVLLERSDFSYGYDDGWDGDLMGNNTAAPRIYTRSESGTRDIVSAVPDFEGMKIYFRAGTDDSEYTFHFTYDEEAEPLYLEDTETDQVTRVVSGNSYTFQTTDNLAYGRFILTRTPSYMPTGIGGAEIDEDTGPRKFLSGDQIYIIRAGVVYDATGRKINENTNHLTEEAL